MFLFFLLYINGQLFFLIINCPQVTGEAEYIDDMPHSPQALHAALVLSKRAHARILSIDDMMAKSSPGFVGLFLYRDIPGSNKLGVILKDEELFASEIVTCVGQV